MNAHPNEHQKTLMTLSIKLWFISLLLPAFYEGQSPMIGAELFLYFPVAFMQPLEGLALYANVFYWWMCWRLYRGKRPYIALWLMLTLASFTVKLSHYNQDTQALEADLWGYGAFVWGLSIILMAAAMLDTREYFSRKATLAPYLIPFAILMLALHILKACEWLLSNSYEREHFFRPFSIYTPSFIPRGVPYNPPPQDLPNRDQAPLEVEGELLLKNDHFYLKIKEDDSRFNGGYNLPLPSSFLYRGYRIDRRNDRYTIQPSNQQAYYRYRVPYIGEDKITLVLDDARENREIWRSDNFFHKKYPDSRHYVTDPYPNFKSDIVKLFEPDREKRDPLPPPPVRFDKRCPTKTLSFFWQMFEYSKNLKFVDDFIVLLKTSTFRSIQFNDVFLCHKDWVLTVDAYTFEHSLDAFELYAELLNRDDLSRIDGYDKKFDVYRELYYELDYNEMTAEQRSALVDLHKHYGVHALERGLRAVDFDLSSLRLHFDFGEIVLISSLAKRKHAQNNNNKKRLFETSDFPQHRTIIKAKPYVSP